VVAALLVLASKATEGVNTGGCGTGEGSAKKKQEQGFYYYAINALENQRRVCATFQYKINALIFVTKHV
jgi:hypothetical protein